MGSGQEGLRKRNTRVFKDLKEGQCGWKQEQEGQWYAPGSGKGQVGTGSCFLSRAEGLALLVNATRSL